MLHLLHLHVLHVLLLRHRRILLLHGHLLVVHDRVRLLLRAWRLELLLLLIERHWELLAAGGWEGALELAAGRHHLRLADQLLLL